MIVDFHAYLGRWPVFPLQIRNATGLVQRMDRIGIGASFVSNVEGVLAWDCNRANQQLARSVARYRSRLLPVGVVNVALAGWAADVQEGIRRFDLAGFRLFPTYHGYCLDSPEVAALADLLAEQQLPLFIAAFIDDERFQPLALRASPVSVDGMIGLIRRAPHTVIVLNNLTPEEILQLLREPDLALDNVFVDVAALDKPFDGLAQVLSHGGGRHLVYGSQVPFLYPEATLALVQENGFAAADVEAILAGNCFNHSALTRLINSRIQ